MSHIRFLHLISDFDVSYRISRLKSDLHITFLNRIFAPQSDFLHFKLKSDYMRSERSYNIAEKLDSLSTSLPAPSVPRNDLTTKWLAYDTTSKFCCKLYCLALVINN